MRRVLGAAFIIAGAMFAASSIAPAAAKSRAAVLGRQVTFVDHDSTGLTARRYVRHRPVVDGYRPYWRWHRPYYQRPYPPYFFSPYYQGYEPYGYWGWGPRYSAWPPSWYGFGPRYYGCCGWGWGGPRFYGPAFGLGFGF
jgi:hypothetical protein